MGVTWQGPRGARNPLYSSRAWAEVKQHWITLAIPCCRAANCLMPGIPIDYTKPRTKPNSLNVGHITPVWAAYAMGWTAQQTWSIANSRPEHRRCNLVEGARMGQR